MNQVRDALKLVRITGRILKNHPFVLGYLGLSLLAGVLIIGGALVPVIRNIKAGESQILKPYLVVDSKSKDHNSIADKETRRKELHSRFHPQWKIIGMTASCVYFPLSFIFGIMNVAFIFSIRQILNGQKTSFIEGLEIAWQRRYNLLVWILFSLTIGLFIELISQKIENWIVRRVLHLTGLSWSILSMLALPVIAIEGGLPVNALRRSAQLYSRKWSQAFIGLLGIKAARTAVWILIGVIPGILIISSALSQLVKLESQGLPAYTLITGFSWIFISLIALNLIGEVISMTYKVALYIYANEGVIPEEYRDENISWFINRN